MRRALAAAVVTAGLTLLSAAPAQAMITNSTAYDGVCAQLTEHNSADGVVIVVLGLKAQGYSDNQVADLLVGAVMTTCPKFTPAVLAFADKYGE